MKSDSCQVQMTSLSLTFTDMLASCLPLDRSHLLKLFLWCHAGLLCQTKGLLHLSRQGLLCDLRDRQWKRERICLPLSWTCSHSCFVRISSDGCCFNLFSPHFFCLFFLNFHWILSPFSITVALFRLIFSCDTVRAYSQEWTCIWSAYHR